MKLSIPYAYLAPNTNYSVVYCKYRQTLNAPTIVFAVWHRNNTMNSKEIKAMLPSSSQPTTTSPR